MEELFEKLEVLKEEISQLETVKELVSISDEVKKDKELIEKIEKYNYTKDERLREEIIKNELFRKYNHLEAELNFMILEINQKLKKISSKGSCGI